jgi:hypothetical protein
MNFIICCESLQQYTEMNNSGRPLSTFPLNACLSRSYEMTYQPLKMNMLSHSKLQDTLNYFLHSVPGANTGSAQHLPDTTPTATAILDSRPHPTLPPPSWCNDQLTTSSLLSATDRCDSSHVNTLDFPNKTLCGTQKNYILSHWK